MMRLFKLVAALVAAVMFSGPASAWSVGHDIGIVRLQPGSTICDTIEDALLAIARLAGESDEMPASCGYMRGAPLVMIKVIDHKDIGGKTFAVLRILFMPPSKLGIQYGWALDPEPHKDQNV